MFYERTEGHLWWEGAGVCHTDTDGTAGALAHMSCMMSAIPSASPVMQNSPLLLKAEGSAVSKAVTVAEIVRRRLRGLHQNTQIRLATGSHSDEQRTSWPPMPSIAITLSTAPLDPTQPG